jgi:rifampicin phosphotransferase
LPGPLSKNIPTGKFVNGFMYSSDESERELKEGWSEKSSWIFHFPKFQFVVTKLLLEYTPLFVLRLATNTMFKVIPAASSFEQQCKFILKNKPWLKDLEFWDTIRRPKLIKRHTELIEIDPRNIELQEELLEYLLDVIDHFRFCAFNHHRFNSAAMLPVNFFLRFSEENGLGKIDAYELLEGTLKEQVYEHSSGNQLRAAFGQSKNSNAYELLKHAVIMSDDKSLSKREQDDEILDVLNALRYDLNYSTEIRESMTNYLNENWYRQVGGYDLTFYSGGEMPGMLASAIWRIIHDDLEQFQLKHARNIELAKKKLNPDKYEEWLELLEDAHKCHRLRDERSLYSDIWATGILRRALLEVGKRFANNNDSRNKKARTILFDINHILFIQEDELIALLKKQSSLNDHDNLLLNGLNERLKSRYLYSMQTLLSHAPSTINGPYVGSTGTIAKIIDATILDKDVRRVLLGIVDIAKVSQSNMNLHGDANKPGTKILRGDSGSKGKYTGRAKLIRKAEDFMSVQRGDVIFSEFTNSSFTLVMSKAGAVVTEVGGTLSHAAIVCRESKVPCVTNCTHAMLLIQDGDIVSVNGDDGYVVILEHEISLSISKL